MSFGANRRTPKDSAIVDCLWISLCAGLIAALLQPFQNTPFIDDWAYAWPVEHLLRTGEWKILDWSTSINIAQVAWGALFCLPFGFSFTALRISTFVLSVSGMCGLYLLLRELEAGRRAALIGAAILGAYPVYFVLSFSFMTDVPFVAITIWFCLAGVKAIRLQQTRWIAASAALAALACGIRLTGVALPIAMLAALLLHSGRWGRSVGRVILAVAPLAAVGALLLWNGRHVEHRADLTYIQNSPTWRLANLKYGFLFFHKTLFPTVTLIAGVLGFALIPCAAGCFRREHLRRTAWIGAVLLLMLGGQWLIDREPFNPPLASGETWAVFELGLTEEVAPHYERPEESRTVKWLSCVIGTLLFSMAVAPVMRRAAKPGVPLLLWLLAIQIALMIVLWLFGDRYAMTLAPVFLVLILAGTGVARPLIAGLLLAVLLAWSIVGTLDHLRYNAALWGAVDRLLKRGVPASDLNGGYIVNGWLQYAHPENAKRDSKGDVMVAGVNAKERDVRLPYQISNSPVRGWTQIDAIPYHRWLGRSGSIYILQFQPRSRR